jgi:hypothetical protein
MITFVATAFEEKYESMAFIGSMLAQKDQRWKAIIYGNKHSVEIDNILQLINDSRITYKVSETNTGFWGCYNRIEALNNLVDTEYIVQTSIQDYYLPNAVSEILKRNEDFIYWNALHNHFEWEKLDAFVKIGSIDWGCFAVKTEIAKNIGIKIPEKPYADGAFAESCNGKCTFTKIDKTLTIHN